MEIEASLRLATGVGDGLQKLKLAGLEVAPGERKPSKLARLERISR